MIHRPFLRSAIQVVGDFRIGDFDLQSERLLIFSMYLLLLPVYHQTS